MEVFIENNFTFVFSFNSNYILIFDIQRRACVLMMFYIFHRKID